MLRERNYCTGDHAPIISLEMWEISDPTHALLYKQYADRRIQILRAHNVSPIAIRIRVDAGRHGFGTVMIIMLSNLVNAQISTLHRMTNRG